MPLSPFMGLSMVVHVVIIMIHAIFGAFIRFGTGKEAPKRVPVYSTVLSAFILVSVFLFVNWSVFTILTGSFESKYSTFHIAESYTDHDLTKALHDNLTVMPGTLTAHTADQAVVWLNSYRDDAPAQLLVKLEKTWLGLTSFTGIAEPPSSVQHIPDSY